MGTVGLGIDFGTFNTAAVVRTKDGRTSPLLFDGSPLLPSSVYVDAAGAIVTGRDALQSSRVDPARFEPNPKRRVDDSVVLLGDREIPVTDLIAAVLSRVSDECRRVTGGASGDRLDVVLTCPASWGATRQLVLADAAAAAGLGRVQLVAEPVAAAAYFTGVLDHKVPVGSVVVVYDFGAGTFDASVVARTGAGFEILVVEGRDDLGGLDIDNSVVEHLRTTGDPDVWRRLREPSTVEERRAHGQLWHDVREAKERLSRLPTADLVVPSLAAGAHLTRDELDVLARSIVEQTVRITQGVLRFSNIAENRIAGVFLVGGSSRMPLVATLLHRALKRAPVVIEQPELAVAAGSLLAGAAPSEASAPVDTPQRDVDVADAHVRDGRYTEALTVLDRVVSRAPDDVIGLQLRAETHRRLGKLDAALTDLDRALELDSSDARSWAQRGLVHRELERYEPALADLGEAVRLAPDNATFRGDLGATRVRAGDPRGGLVDIERAIALDPGQAWMYADRGVARQRLGQLAEALGDVNRALQMDPQGNLAWMLAERAAIHRDLGDLDAALVDYNVAVTLSPDVGWIAGARGQVHHRRGNLTAALADLDTAILLSPDQAWVFEARARVHYDLGHREQALADVDTALALRPDAAWIAAAHREVHDQLT
nr:hypothetical protein GCM10020063_092160 [Dactylosporangium thailandense]